MKAFEGAEKHSETTVGDGAENLPPLPHTQEAAARTEARASPCAHAEESCWHRAEQGGGGSESVCLSIGGYFEFELFWEICPL